MNAYDLSIKKFGMFSINYYVEDRGENATTRYKHFLNVTILHFWNIRCTFRSPHVYPLYFNNQEYLPKHHQ